MPSTSNTAAGRYEQFTSKRRPFLDRAREVSTLTISSLMPPDGHSGANDLPSPWQGLGARGVNNLAAKLLLTLLPPNAPFFRLRVDEVTLRELEQQAANVKTEFDKALGSVERSVMVEVETSAIRVPLYEALRLLIASGNVLVHYPQDGNVRVFSLDRYVVIRDPAGNLLEAIVKENVSPLTLSEEQRAALQSLDIDLGKDSGEDVAVYTRIWRDKSRSGKDLWRVAQEINGQEVQGSRGQHPIDRLPWLALRFGRIDGEHYGRSFVEEFVGDLKSLEGLTRAIVEGSAAASKVLFLVNPNGVTELNTISQSENGDVREGRADDVSVLQVQKFADFRTALETARQLTERLNAAFLMNASATRNAERVTAEEIRFMAAELEDALGGLYSLLGQELQLPLVRLVIDRMQKTKKLPKFPKTPGGDEVVKPMITTGLEALGRGQDLNRLRGFIEDLGIVGQADASLLQRLKGENLIEQLATARGVDTKDLFLSDQEVAALQQQQQMAQMAAQATPAVVKEGAKAAFSQQNQGS